MSQPEDMRYRLKMSMMNHRRKHRDRITQDEFCAQAIAAHLGQEERGVIAGGHGGPLAVFLKDCLRDRGLTKGWAPKARALLESLGHEVSVASCLQFMDTAGNGYINQPGMFIQITGQRPEVDPWKEAATFKGFTPTGLKILYAFTCKPELLNAPFREIAKAADVGLGTVADIIADLRKQGFAVMDENVKRRLFNTQQLRQTWIETYPIRLRGKLQGKRFTAPDPEWWKDARPREQGAYWGSEVAAAKLTGYLIPQTCTLYTHEDPKALILRYRLRPDPTGTVEVLKAFWDPALPQGPAPHEDVVHPMLVEADLKAIDDPRTNETARLIHDKFLT